MNILHIGLLLDIDALFDDPIKNIISLKLKNDRKAVLMSALEFN